MNLVKKRFETFADIAEKKDDYKIVYEQLGKTLMLGVYVDSTNRTKVAFIKLYVRQVFIMDDCDALVPQWLNMVEGVTGDSEDVIYRVIKMNLVKNRFETFADIAEEKDEYCVQARRRTEIHYKGGSPLRRE